MPPPFVATPGEITPNAALPGAEDGGLAEREKLEEKHAKAIKAAFDEVLRQVVPRGTREDSITPELAMQRYRAHGGVLRDALVAMLQETGLVGAAMGRAQVEAILGVGSPRRTNVQGPRGIPRRRRRWHVQAAARVGLEGRYNQVRIVATDWDLVNQNVLAWVLGGHGEFGTGYGDTLAAALAQTSEGLIRSLIAEWIQNGAPLRELIAALEATVFSRERAELIAVTEVTRSFFQGNLEAWRASGIITQKIFQTSADELVCAICGPLQGQVRLLDEEFDGGVLGPPLHPKCRCFCSPYV